MGFIACEKGPSNTSNVASSRAQENVEEDWDMRLGADPCKASNKLKALQDKYHDKNVDTDDAGLNDQRRNNKYDIVIEPDPIWGIAMRIKGRIGLDDRPRKLTKLMKFIEKDLEKGCIQRVSFESMTSAAGLEWTICNDPERPCPPPNGECGHCMVNANSNTNPTPPVNSNTNVREIPNRSNQSNTNSGP
jgi:hypothetical protein